MRKPVYKLIKPNHGNEVIGEEKTIIYYLCDLSIAVLPLMSNLMFVLTHSKIYGDI